MTALEVFIVYEWIHHEVMMIVMVLGVDQKGVLSLSIWKPLHCAKIGILKHLALYKALIVSMH